MKSRYTIILLLMCVTVQSQAVVPAVKTTAAKTSKKKLITQATDIISDGQRLHINKLKSQGKLPSLRFNRRNGVVEYIRQWQLTQANGKDRAKQFLKQNQILFKLQDVNNELKLKKRYTDRLNFQHEFYQQLHQGLPIWNRGLKLHIGPQGKLVVTGNNIPTASAAIPTQASISAQQATTTVLQALGLNEAQTNGELLYLDYEDQLRLCYRINIQKDLNIHWDYFVDATSGQIIRRINRVQHEVVNAQGEDLFNQNQNLQVWYENNQYYLLNPKFPLDDAPYDPVVQPKNRGNFYILDAVEGNGNNLEFISSVSASGPWDPTGITAAVHVKRVYDYYKQTFARNSLDNNNMNLQGIIHYQQNYANAFWNGRSMVFGDGDARVFDSLVKCLDVTAHEMTHGVIQYSADFIYENQSGALNESFADVFASFVDGNWTMGEDCILQRPGYLRNLQDPSLGLRSQPSKMSEYVDLPNNEQGDYGGVHVNSGIPNHAAYLTAEQLGIPQTQEIYYRALTQYLGPQDEFIHARRGLVQAAIDLYGATSPVIEVIHHAWDQVEVFDDSRGVPPQPVLIGNLSLNTQVLDFGSLTIGDSKTLNLQLTNDGNLRLQLSRIVSNNVHFTVDGDVADLTVGSRHNLSVTFSATDLGTQTGSLSFEYQGLDQPVQVSLLGVSEALPPEPVPNPQPQVNQRNTVLGTGSGAISIYFLMLIGLLKIRGIKDEK